MSVCSKNVIDYHTVIMNAKYKTKSKPLSVAIKSKKMDYDTDFFKWVYAQADLLRKGEFGKLDTSKNLMHPLD